MADNDFSFGTRPKRRLPINPVRTDLSKTRLPKRSSLTDSSINLNFKRPVILAQAKPKKLSKKTVYHESFSRPKHVDISRSEKFLPQPQLFLNRTSYNLGKSTKQSDFVWHNIGSHKKETHASLSRLPKRLKFVGRSISKSSYPNWGSFKQPESMPYSDSLQFRQTTQSFNSTIYQSSFGLSESISVKQLEKTRKVANKSPTDFYQPSPSKTTSHSSFSSKEYNLTSQPFPENRDWVKTYYSPFHFTTNSRIDFRDPRKKQRQPQQCPLDRPEVPIYPFFAHQMKQCACKTCTCGKHTCLAGGDRNPNLPEASEENMDNRLTPVLSEIEIDLNTREEDSPEIPELAEIDESVRPEEEEDCLPNDPQDDSVTTSLPELNLGPAQRIKYRKHNIRSNLARSRPVRHRPQQSTPASEYRAAFFPKT